MSTTKESLGLFQAIGFILSSTVEILVRSVSAIVPAITTVENLTTTAEMHSGIFRSQATHSYEIEMHKLNQLIAKNKKEAGIPLEEEPEPAEPKQP